ncbi:MAG: hypothetical protein ACI86M_002529 [Saprospiraceae bacterium]
MRFASKSISKNSDSLTYTKNENRKQKMLGGILYDAIDKQLTNDRLQTRLLLKELNDLREGEED